MHILLFHHFTQNKLHLNETPPLQLLHYKTITYFAYSQLQQIETAISCYLPLIS